MTKVKKPNQDGLSVQLDFIRMYPTSDNYYSIEIGGVRALDEYLNEFDIPKEVLAITKTIKDLLETVKDRDDYDFLYCKADDIDLLHKVMWKKYKETSFDDMVRDELIR